LVVEELVASKLSIPEELIELGFSERSTSVGVRPFKMDDTDDVVLDTRLFPRGRLQPSVSTLTLTKPAESSSVAAPNEPLASAQLLTVSRKLQ
jgi:hypothetical protein